MNPSPFITTIGLDQHMVMFGAPGAGKSFRTALQVRGRIQTLLQNRIKPSTYKMIIVDSKNVGLGGDNRLGNFVPLIKTTKGMLVWDWRDIDWTDNHYLYVYRLLSEAKQDTDNLNEFFQTAHNRMIRTARGVNTAMPFTIVVDELVDVSSSASNRVIYLSGLTMILAEGRASAQTMWIETQTPSYVHGDIRRLTTVRFVFRLPEPNDREYVANFLGYKVLKQRITDPYGFYYQNDLVDGGRLFYFNGWRDR